MENTLTLSEFKAPTTTLSDEAILAKSNVLDELKSYQEIKDINQAFDAAVAMKAAKKLCSEVESARKTIIEPLLNAQREAMFKKNEFTSEIEVETKRLSSILGVYEKNKREEAARIKREEAETLRLFQARIQEQADERMRLEREASDRKIAEARAAKNKVAENEARLEKHAQKAAIDDAARKAKELAKTESKAVVAVAAPVKTVTLRDEWKFEVTNINKLQFIHPQLVKVIPNNDAIRKAIKESSNKQIFGLRIWNEPKAI